VRLGRFCSARWLALGAVLPVLAVWLSGCLECQESILGRYDADKDQFVFLNLYQRIGGQKPADYDYLEQLYNNRDHLVTPPIPNMLGKTSYLRLSAKTYYQLNLGDRPNALEPQETPLPLDQVKVLPGQFFLRGPEALCYYDQIVVPGAFVDQTLKFLGGKAAESIAQAVREEIDRRKGGGKAIPWAELRQNMVNSIEKKEEAAAAAPNQGEDEHKTDPIRAFSDESLQLLTAAAENGAGFSRSKSVFRFVLPLADKDVTEALDVLKTVRATLAAQLQKPDHDKDIATQALLIEAMEAKPLPGKGLELSTDAVAFFPRVQKAMDPTAELPAPQDPDAALRFKTAVETMRGKGIPISDSLTVPQILADFQAGKLGSNPPAKSLTPGEGIKVQSGEQ
jgi:hypothetical protein